MDATQQLADRLRASEHWRDAALDAECEAELGERYGPSAQDLLAVRLERAFGEAFSRHRLDAIRWGELAGMLLEAEAIA